MAIKIDGAATLLGKVRSEILEEYKKIANFEEVPISVDILRDIIKQRCNLRSISWQAVVAETPNILGSVKFRYPVPVSQRTNEEPTTAIVLVREDLNFCWCRFVICKEMCHCLVDARDDRVSSVSALRDLAQGLASKVTIPGTGNGPLESELWAELLAIELLFPYELRKTHRQALKDGTITPYTLALRYRIPREYAELGMFDNVLDLMGKILG